MKRKVSIRDVEKPNDKSHEEGLKWICDSLSLVSGRDVEDSSFKIMSELLNKFSENNMVSTEDLSDSLGMDSPRINHHLRRLMESGIVNREKRKVVLRGRSLTDSIKEMKRDSDKLFEKLMDVSKRVDREFGLE
ncbi:MAG: ArsR family transcriptional regulator [Candidatus Pacearchaeota archaeon]